MIDVIALHFRFGLFGALAKSSHLVYGWAVPALPKPTWTSALAVFTRTLGEERGRKVLAAQVAMLGIENYEDADVATLQRIATSLVGRNDVTSMLGVALEIRCKTYLSVGQRPGSPHAGAQRKADATRLDAIRKLDLARDDARQLLDEAARRAAAALGLPIGLVSIVLDDAQWFAGKQGVGDWLANANGTPVEWSFCAYVARDRAPLVVEDASKDERFAKNPLVTFDGIRSYAGVPLETSDGVTLGSLCAIGAERRTMTPDELATLREIADETIRGLEALRATSS